MAIDLSALEIPESVHAAANALPSPTGKPLDLPLSDIDEDPEQPRKEFAPEAMAEMVASIKTSGVKSPVSVRPHPTVAGRWMLNYGARRLRGSKEAGLRTIPAFVDEQHNSYDQVIENLQRQDLTPMELALFIKNKLAQGEKHAGIAKKLGKDRSMVTEHMALIDAPACLEEAYANRKTRSPKTMYELRKLHDKHPEQIEAWCVEQTEITRSGVEALANSLSGKTRHPKAEPGTTKSVGHDQHSGGGNGTGGNEAGQGGTGRGDNSAGQDGGKAATTSATNPHGTDNGELTSWPAGKAVADPELMKKPLLLVEYDGRGAAVLLNRRPSAPGLIRIRFDDGGGDAEVDAGRCKINSLLETKA